METNKTVNVNDELRGQKSTNILIGYVLALAAMFVAFEYYAVEVNVADLEAWVLKQPQALINILETTPVWLRDDLHRFEMLLKRNPKPNLDKDYDRKIASPQVIAACSKEFNALFSPIVANLKNRLLAVLKKNFFD